MAALLVILLAPAWLLPEQAWSPICRQLARLPWLISSRAVARNAANIQAAFGEAHEQAAAIALALEAAIFESHMQDLRAWRPGGWRPSIALEGKDHLLQALARGNGVILWVAHLVFNHLTPKMALHRRGHRISHLSSVEHGAAKSRIGVALINAVRRIPEDCYLAERILVDRRAPSIAMRRMMRALAAGHIVTITAVATEGSDVMVVPFLGGLVNIATGAPRLAALTRAPLLPVFAVRDPQLGFRVVIQAPIATAVDRSPDEHCLVAANEFLARCEPWARQFPDQWRGWNKWRQV